jgi:hypothetical protein
MYFNTWRCNAGGIFRMTGSTASTDSMATFSLSNHIVFPAYCFFHDTSGTGPGLLGKKPI